MALFALRAPNGKFVRAFLDPNEHDADKRNYLDAHVSSRGPWETFESISLGNKKYAIRTHFGRFIRAVGGGGDRLLVDRDGDHVKEHESFELISIGPSGSFKQAIKSYGGGYWKPVRVETGFGGSRTEIHASGTSIGPNETFAYIPVQLSAAPILHVQLKTLGCVRTADEEIRLQILITNPDNTKTSNTIPFYTFYELGNGEAWHNNDLCAVPLPRLKSVIVQLELVLGHDTFNPLGMVTCGVTHGPQAGKLRVGWAPGHNCQFVNMVDNGQTYEFLFSSSPYRYRGYFQVKFRQ